MIPSMNASDEGFGLTLQSFPGRFFLSFFDFDFGFASVNLPGSRDSLRDVALRRFFCFLLLDFLDLDFDCVMQPWTTEMGIQQKADD